MFSLMTTIGIQLRCIVTLLLSCFVSKTKGANSKHNDFPLQIGEQKINLYFSYIFPICFNHLSLIRSNSSVTTFCQILIGQFWSVPLRPKKLK